MNKLRVLAIPSDVYGVGKYRILDPYKYIAENYSDSVHVDIIFDVENNDKIFEIYDIVIFHSFIHKLPIEDNLKRIKWLRSKGVKVIMDIDDYWSVNQTHPMYYQVKKNKLAEAKTTLLKSVDYITCTTKHFADEIKSKLNLKNVFVFPNAVNEDEEQFKIKKIPSNRVRFGWLGGSSHLSDLTLLKSGIDDTLSKYNDKTQFVLCGFDTRGVINEINKLTGEEIKRDIKPEETVWFNYEKIFTNNYKFIEPNYKSHLLKYIQIDYPITDVSYRRVWTKDIKTYAENYNLFDVSLAPLDDNYFNSCKSELKVIEAGFHKKALISSDVLPYNTILKNKIVDGKVTSDGNSLLVSSKRNHKDWAKHMKRLIESPSLIEDLGNSLYETVKVTYSLKKVCEDRVDFLKRI